MIDHCSYTHNWSSCEIKSWKKFRPEWDSNPWPLRYRCSALVTELSSHLGAGHFVSLQYTHRRWRTKWIYEGSYIWTAEKDFWERVITGHGYFLPLCLKLLTMTQKLSFGKIFGLHFINSSGTWSYVFRETNISFEYQAPPRLAA